MACNETSRVSKLNLIELKFRVIFEAAISNESLISAWNSFQFVKEMPPLIFTMPRRVAAQIGQQQQKPVRKEPTPVKKPAPVVQKPNPNPVQQQQNPPPQQQSPPPQQQSPPPQQQTVTPSPNPPPVQPVRTSEPPAAAVQEQAGNENQPQQPQQESPQQQDSPPQDQSTNTPGSDPNTIEPIPPQLPELSDLVPDGNGASSPAPSDSSTSPENPVQNDSPTPAPIQSEVPADSTVNSSEQSITSNQGSKLSSGTVMAITFPLLAVAILLVVGLIAFKRRGRQQAAVNGASRLNTALENTSKRMHSWFETHIVDNKQKLENNEFDAAKEGNTKVPALGMSWIQPKLKRATRKIYSWFETHEPVEEAIVDSDQFGVQDPNLYEQQDTDYIQYGLEKTSRSNSTSTKISDMIENLRNKELNFPDNQ